MEYNVIKNNNGTESIIDENENKIEVGGKMEFYYSSNYGDYIEIQFNYGEKWKLFKKGEFSKPVNIGGETEFYWSSDYGKDYIGIKFNGYDKYKLFRKGEFNKIVNLAGQTEFYHGFDYGDCIDIKFNEGDDYEKFYYKDLK